MSETKTPEAKPNPFNNPSNPGNAVKEPVGENRFTFPREFSNIVYIRRKKITGLPEENAGTDDSKWKIGSALKGTVTLRGLKPIEEERWLGPMLSVAKGNQNYDDKLKEFWINIGRPVPPTNKDGSGGLELEIGLKYNTQEDYEADKKAFRSVDGVIENPKGEPINLNDYILWRYCLLYGKVANTPEDVSKSPKIDFFIFSKEREIRSEKASFDERKRATQLMYSRLNDRAWVDHVLRLFIQRDKSSPYTIRGIGRISDDEKDVLLEKYKNETPAQFVSYGEDKHLEMKSFIEVCVASGLLTRIPNTNTISLDGLTLGNTMDEVVRFLKDPTNNPTLTKLQAQLQVTPS